MVLVVVLCVTRRVMHSICSFSLARARERARSGGEGRGARDWRAERKRPPAWLATGGLWLAPLLIVVVEAERVQGMLLAGVGPALPSAARCPCCGGLLDPWGSYPRLVRWGGRIGGLRVRRCRCGSCGVTHALLPSFLLARRMDLAAAIGMALAMAAAGRGHRPSAAAAGVPETTARGWLRRLRAQAAVLRMGFARLAWDLGSQTARAPPTGDRLSWLADAITAAHRAARERFGEGVPRCAWAFSSAASGGMWLANTDTPWQADAVAGNVADRPPKRG